MTPKFKSTAKKAIINRYVSAALGYETAYPNARFTRPASGVWIQMAHLAVDLVRAAMGQVAINGVLQLSVHAQPDTGTEDLLDAVDAISNLFPVEEVWTYLGEDYMVTNIDVNEMTTEDDRLTVVMTLYWLTKVDE